MSSQVARGAIRGLLAQDVASRWCLPQLLCSGLLPDELLRDVAKHHPRLDKDMQVPACLTACTTSA